MELVRISASPKQLSKLRNQHRVRLSPPKGDIGGCGLYVNLKNYDHINKAFKLGKGTTVSLDPEEIKANYEAALSDDEKIGGSGLFASGAGMKGGKLAIQHRAFRNILPVMKNVGEKISKPYEKVFQVNPFSLGFQVGSEVIAPELKRLPGIREHYGGKIPNPKRLVRSVKNKANSIKDTVSDSVTNSVDQTVGAGIKQVGLKQLKKVAKNILKNVVMPAAKRAIKSRLSRQTEPVEAVAEWYQPELTEAYIVKGEGLYASGQHSGRGVPPPNSRLPFSPTPYEKSTFFGGSIMHPTNPNLRYDPRVNYTAKGLPPQYRN